MISLINRWIFGPQVQTSKVVDLSSYGIPECVKCHDFLRSHMILGLMAHLSKDHQMHEDKSIDAASHMMNLVLKAKRRK